VIEFGRETVAWIRRNEDDLLTELRGEPLHEIERRHEEAQQLMQEARAHAWVLDRSARFLMGAADNLMQPLAPTLEELDGGAPPPRWRFDPKVLERHWSQLQEWNARPPEEAAQGEGGSRSDLTPAGKRSGRRLASRM
jgi:hypothetical protein